MSRNFYNRIYQSNVDKIDKILFYNELDDIIVIIYYVNIHNFNYCIDFLNKQHDYTILNSESVFYLYHYDNINMFFFNVELKIYKLHLLFLKHFYVLKFLKLNLKNSPYSKYIASSK